MAFVNWTTVAFNVSSVAKIVKELAPVAAVAGPEGAALGAIVGQAATFVSAIADQAAAVEPALDSQDMETIQVALTAIQQANDMLAQQTAAS